jgi:hypothetical protein
VDSGDYLIQVAAPSADKSPEDVPAPSRRRSGARLTGVHVVRHGQAPAAAGGLTFSFAGSDEAADLQRFRYRLDGLDPVWIETAGRSARYPLLRPGPYRFEVQAATGMGAWSAPAGLSFTVFAPPWWRHPPVLAGLGLLGISLAVSLLTAGRARRLLQVERLRAVIAADLHDRLGAGLTDIAILSEVARRRASDLPELARIASTARELVDGMGDIVWLVHPRRDALHELFLRLKDGYAELFALQGALLTVGDLSALEKARLPMPYRQDLHLLFKEALRNALRHSGCRHAELSVRLRGRHLEVVLRDDGRGFNPEQPGDNGEGLEAMRCRAARLGGRLGIESGSEGTVVCFAGKVPGRGHLASPQLPAPAAGSLFSGTLKPR